MPVARRSSSAPCPFFPRLAHRIPTASPASTPGSAIAVCVEQADGSIRLTVQDHGQGIPADKLARVVEPFYMVDKSRSRKKGGAGLGLAVCSEILRLHGGLLEFVSQPGQGTCARVWLRGEYLHAEA